MKQLNTYIRNNDKMDTCNNYIYISKHLTDVIIIYLNV